MPVRAIADAGWRPDPAGADDVWRWWTGTAWTAWLSDDPDAPPPPQAEAGADPRAGTEIAPVPGPRFGAAARTVMGLVTLVVVIAGLVIIGAPYGQRVALTASVPSQSYVPPDLSVRCDRDRWTVGGAVSVEVPDDMVTFGPDVSETIGLLRCRGVFSDPGRDGMALFGLADPLHPGETLEQRANDLADRLAETSYVKGPATWTNRVGQASPVGQDTWQITGDLTGLPDAVGAKATIILIPLPSGHLVMWFDLLGASLTDEYLAGYEALRSSLTRS